MDWLKTIGGNMMKNCKFRLMKTLFIIFLIATFLFNNLSSIAATDDVEKILDGKTISILGDSISTFENVSCGDASLTANNTIKNNRLYYSDGKNGVHLNDTWWMQITDILGGQILVNNSYSGSQVYDPANNSLSQGYLSRSVNLHDNTGLNDGQTPDIILVYMGYNDFAYCRNKLGTFDTIDFKKLIKPEGDAVYYAAPETTCEAYSIMIHKIRSKYPDAEVYCFNLPPRSLLTESNIQLFTQFNDDIRKIAEQFDCILVDNYTDSGIEHNNENIYCYLADGIHPNRNGMDAITNSFLKAFYENSRYLSDNVIRHSIEYELDNVIVDQGTLKTELENNSLFCSFTSTTGSPADISVTLDDIDITDLCVKDGCVNLPRISGKIKIKASTTKPNETNNSYRFIINDDSLKTEIIDENTENNITQNSGYISNGVIYDGAFKVEKTITLLHNKPWSIVWNAKYNENYHCMTLSNYNSSTKERNNIIHFLDSNPVLCFGDYKNGAFLNYGINLKEHNIDITQQNEYRLSNVIDGNGNNMIYLYINGKKTGALNQYYSDNQFVGKSNTWCNGRDFYYNYIGTTDDVINACKLDFLQIWENTLTENHIHNYIYTNEYEPTCTEDGYTEVTCICGNAITDITAQAHGHTETKWIVEKPASVHESGKAYTECTVCKEILQRKVLHQLTPAAPQITKLVNEIKGIKVSWSAVSGADSYRVYRRGAGSKYWTYVCTTTKTYYLDTNVKNNQYWRYTIRSVNEGGYGAFDTDGQYIKFVSTPKILKGYNTATGIKIEWSAVTGATRYNVYRNRVGQTKWTYIGCVNGTSYNDSTIKNANGVDYRYSVKAYAGYKSAFDTTGFIVRRLSPPALKTAVSYPTGIYINWTPIAGTTGYYVYRKTDKSNWRLIGSAGGATNTAYFDKTALKGTKYTYTVKACYGKTLSTHVTKGITCVDKY